MLSPEMAAELRYFCATICYGVLVSLCYHLLLFVRTLVRHGTSLIDAEDILFLGAAGIRFFLTAYTYNNGILRWYAFLGAGFGCFAYKRTLGTGLESVRKWILQKKHKTVKIKTKLSKGQVSTDERKSPEHRKKRKQKERS
ncbi:MAG: spore cortex biosynthesis protein YabQ [Lachnospiraceae bacterium]|nr:spore cortex biosynthesis protein YabQ [Lachnospiraceae bacterium]